MPKPIHDQQMHRIAAPIGGCWDSVPADDATAALVAPSSPARIWAIDAAMSAAEFGTDTAGVVAVALAADGAG
jgi:hypothetical protein